jgi:predicted nucleic acid-binding protein
MLVSNASTLILLAKATVLGRFLELHGPVAVPSQVSREVAAKDGLDSRLVRKGIEGGLVLVKEVDERSFKGLVAQFRLDAGEAAAFALMVELGGRLLLTDDKELIKLCRVEGVPFTCAPAVVVSMFRKGELSRAEAIEKLDALQDYGRYSQKVFEHFRSEVR